MLASVVEGHGEVGAVPVLLRRIAAEQYGRVDCTVPSPHRVKRGQMISSDFLDRAVQTQMARVGPSGGVLILLDADDDCPVQLAASLRGRLPDPRVEVVVAVREFEAWFHQAPFTARMDLQIAGRVPSFGRLVSAVGRLIGIEPRPQRMLSID